MWTTGQKAILFFMLGMIVGFLMCQETSAQSPMGRMTAVVSFNDAEHLAAISDSIVGVCDTTVIIDTAMVQSSTSSTDPAEWIGLNQRNILWVDTIGINEPFDIFYKIARSTITCRELVCVAVTRRPMGEATGLQTIITGKLTVIFPGTAIITWRKVKP